MKNRLIITEDEKRRILGLHKSLMVEQPVSNPEEYEKIMNYYCVKNHPYMSTQTPTGGETLYVWGNLRFMLNGKYYNIKNPNETFGYYCDPYKPGNINTDKSGVIEANSKQPQPDIPPSKDTIVTDFDRAWDYKKTDNNDVYVKKKNTEKWYKVTDEDIKENILSVVFKVKLPCTFPKEACPGFGGKEWDDDKNTDKDMDLDKQIKFCSKNYCAVKWIQHGLNIIILNDVFVGYDKLKNEKKIEVDGKFGTQTQNLLYKLLGKNTASINDINNQLKKK